MGFSITWCAIREPGAQELLDRCGLSPTGEVEELPESLISMAQLDNGWRVLWYKAYGCPFLTARDLRSISREHDVLLCLVDEHVMACSSELWSGGKRRWWISHEGEQGPKGLATEGELPASFVETKAQMEQAQREAGGDDAEVDYLFEVPLQIAHALVGFRHDEDCALITDDHFVVLSRSAPRKSWLGRLFRK